ncbi:MAG: hypothetical protein E7519_00505, partial [Ruminococcaceae bacterium]|nr:hypothetical protein [Oscillospiraceae bacterium]
MRGKLNMNPQTKRAVVVLSIIALLILIIGVRSCSKQFRQTDKNPAGTEQTESSPEPSGGGIVIDPAPSGGETQPGPSTGSSDITSGEDGASTGQEDGSGKNTGSKPAASSAKPSSSTKPVSSTKPTTPVKPAEPSPTPSAPAQPTPSEPTAPTTPAQPTPPATPGDTDNSGSGSGGHHSYPAAVVEITVPDYSHADTEFQVKTTLLNVKSLEWAVSEDGSDAKQSDFLKGTLDKDGGKITITKQGSYTLTATAKNYGGSTYTFTKKITIHPVYGITVTTKPYAHTDQAFTVSTTLSDNITQQLNWHVYKDGNEMKWADTVTGTLTNVGGSIQIKDKGKYTLKATAYDETSREFAGTAEVEVLPVVEISLQASETAHTDTPALLSAETKELGDLQIAWGATKDGTKVNLSDCTEGKLDNLGGSIRFKEPGDYTITAAATDKSGRTFTAQTESKVYPVAGFSFTLPATAHTDETVPVSVQSSDLQDIKAEWTVLHNGESVPLFDMLEGTLTNEGGSIRFREKGSYVLKATLVDETGREYSYEAGMVIYPVAETGFYLPPATHTDTDVEVMTSFKDTDGLTAVWSLTKDGTALSLADGFNGTLTDSGGKIHFKSVGDYELSATITDSTGRSFTYTAPVTVYPVITVSVELTEETHTDQAATASVELTNAGPLPVVWSISKNGIPATPDNTLTNSGGTISFTEKGDYTVTA